MMVLLRLVREGHEDNGYSAIAANRGQALQQEVDERQQPKVNNRYYKKTTMLPLSPMGGRQCNER